MGSPASWAEHGGAGDAVGIRDSQPSDGQVDGDASVGDPLHVGAPAWDAEVGQRAASEHDDVVIQATGHRQQDLADGCRREWQDQVVADRDDEQLGIIGHDPDGSALEGLAVVIIEDGEDDLAAEPRLRRPPVDVEEPRVRRVRSVGQHLPPPAIGAIPDRQVVWHDVQHHAHPPPVGHGAQVGQALRPAELLRDRLDVDGVVTMAAPGARLQHGR